MNLKVADIIKEEWQNIFKDKRLFAILFLVPIMYTLMFGYLYSNHRVLEINTVVLDEDQTSLSRQIIQAFDASETFHIIDHIYSEAEIEPLIQAGEAEVAIVIPSDMYEKVLRGEEAPILTIMDGSNMLISNTVTKAANTVISTYNYGVGATKLAQSELNNDEIQLTLQSIPFRSRILYNGTFNYSNFLVYGLIGVALQQVLLLGLSLSVTRDKERGNWSRFQEWREVPWKIAYAKTAPYFLISIFNSVLTIITGIKIFGLPSNGDTISVLLLILTFTIALIGIGYLASLFSSNQVGATQVTMLIAVPSFLLSGFTWPLESMPPLLRGLGHCLPLTYFLDGIRDVLIKGAPLSFILNDCLVLLLMGLITLFVALVASSFKLFWNRTNEENVEMVSDK